MQLEWPLDQCAFCLTVFGDGEDHPNRRTDAHVIPVSLGGNLSTTALCFTCNSRTGTQFEGSLPVDPTLRAEIERFAHLVPAFERQLAKSGRDWVAKTPNGQLRMKRTKRGEWRAVRTELEDGSQLTDGREGLAELRGRLAGQGIGSDQVDALLERLKAGEDVRVGDHTFRSHTGDLDLELPWDADPANERAFLSIATHFLATVVGACILVDELDPVRRALAAGDRPGDEAAWTLEPMQAPRDSEPWHRLALLAGEPHAIVEVCLFGRWCYLVHFNRVAWSGDRWGVRFELESRELISKCLDDTASG